MTKWADFKNQLTKQQKKLILSFFESCQMVIERNRITINHTKYDDQWRKIFEQMVEFKQS